MQHKNVLVFVAGTTPQIITETLYAFLQGAPKIEPDEMHVITTTTGKERIEKELVLENRLKTFCKEFGMRPIVPLVHVLRGSDGAYMDDIRTEKDNEAAGDFIANFIKEKSKDENARLFCSIAGGRKTLSFYLGSSLSLFGRSFDRLYHVLVTPEFESHPDFYWKPAKDKTLVPKGNDGKGLKKLNTKDAVISLAELPFIRLREKFALTGKGFMELVREGQKEIDTASAQLPLEIDLQERTIRIGGATIEMVPMELVIYNAFIREKLKRCKYPERPYCLDCTDCFPFLVDLSNRRMLEEMADDYRKAYGHNTGRVDDLLCKWEKGIDVEIFRQNISKINRVIKEHIGDETLSSHYIITAVGRHGSKRHGVKVEKGKIGVRQ